MHQIPFRPLTLLAPVVLALGLAACGSSSSSSSSGPAGRPGGGLFTAKVRSCLTQHGVTLPSGPRGNRRRGAGGTGTAPGAPGRRAGRPPGGRAGRGFGSAKFRSALKACGVTLPAGAPGGGPPGGAPQGQTPPGS